MARKAEPSLLGLPPELRNDIYATVISDFITGKNRIRNVATPAMAQVCRQTRIETLPMFFGEEIFAFGTLDFEQTPQGREISFAAQIDWQPFAYLRVFTPAMIGLMRNVSVALRFPPAPGSPHHWHYLTVNIVDKTVKIGPCCPRWRHTEFGECEYAVDELEQLLQEALSAVDLEGENSPDHQGLMQMFSRKTFEWWNEQKHTG